jgi:hypothetical protein
MKWIALVVALEEEKEEDNKKKNTKWKKKKKFFFSARHHRRVCGCGLLSNVVADTIHCSHRPFHFVCFILYRSVQRPLRFRPMFVAIPSDVHHCSIQCSSLFHLMFILVPFDICQCPFGPFCPSTSVHQHPSIAIYPCRCTVFFKPYVVFDIVVSALYCYKILGHGTTPCLRMMRALPLN